MGWPAELKNRRPLRALSSTQMALMTSVAACISICQPAAAQKFHAHEPSTMDPYSTIYVNDGSCSAGKVLKVQGALKNHRRKKSCVLLSDVPASVLPSRASK